MSKVLLFSGTIIGRAFKTPVSPDPTAPHLSAEDAANGPAEDVTLTIAPGSESMKTGEIRVHVPKLDAGSMIQGQEVDIVIAPTGHMTDTTQTLAKLQDELNTSQGTVEELNNSLHNAEQTSESLRQQLQTMTERAEQAEGTIQQKDTEIQRLEQLVAQATPAPSAPIEAQVVDEGTAPPATSSTPPPTTVTTPPSTTPATTSTTGTGS